MSYIIDSLNENECEESGIKISFWKILSFVLFISLFFVAVILKLLNLQILDNKSYTTRAANNYLTKSDILPDRGIIYSAEKKALVENSPVFKVVIDLNTLDRFKVYKSVYEILPQNLISFLLENRISFDDSKLSEINSSLKLGKEFYELKSFYDEREYSGLKSKLNDFSENSQIKIIEDSYRNYIAPKEYASLMGYVSSIDKDLMVKDSWYTPDSKIGVAGIEKQYELKLRGVKGENSSIYNSKYSVYSSKVTKQDTPGYSLITSINNGLQLKAYASLKNQIEKVKATAGAVVVQNPNTGEVLALVNYPSYDINEFSKGITQDSYNKLLNDPAKPLIDRTIASSFPPGSTFKIVTATAGLSENSLDRDTTIQDVGVINIGNFAYHTWKAGGHGLINIVDALKVSSDIFFYVLGGGHSDYPQIKGLGPWKLYKWAKLFNYGSYLGIDLPNEDSGFVADPDWKKKTYNEDWFVGNSYHFAIGQGFVTATPLQVNAMISAIANGGKIYRPFVVKEIIDTKTMTTIIK